MNIQTRLLLSILLAVSTQGAAQSLNPRQPTSADNISYLFPNQTCSGQTPYIGNPYTVSMTQNQITVRMAARELGNPVGVCPSAPRESVNLGTLPAGSYTLTVIEQIDNSSRPILADFPFTVTDARPAKAAPYVRLDYSGTWWDPADPGWGLFVWQNAASPRDDVLAAWFTFGADGKANWYTFQPTWRTATATNDAPLVQSSRPPSSSNPPPGPNSSGSVGTAALDFTIPFNMFSPDAGVLTYTLGNGAKQTRNIQRFKP
jgi:hypothetical protein